MSEKYKIYPGGLFFVTLTTVGWIDIFTRKQYCDELIDNLNFCIEKKGLILYAFCLMPSHLHMVAAAREGTLSDILRDFKSYTAKRLITAIAASPKESRKEWLIYLFKYFSNTKRNNAVHLFWQHHNHPIDILTGKWLEQKINYIHENPVTAGIVREPEQYVYSSANPHINVRLEAWR